MGILVGLESMEAIHPRFHASGIRLHLKSIPPNRPIRFNRMKMELNNVRKESSAPSAQDNHKQRQAEESTNLRKVLNLLGRWVLTIVFSISIFVVAKTYLAKGIITKTQKATYNLIQTALILALGLSFFVSKMIPLCAY